MYYARALRLTIIVAIAALLSGCALPGWHGPVGGVRVFTEFVPCAVGSSTVPLVDRKFYEVTAAGWWTNEPCHESCSPFIPDNPDRHAYDIRFLDDSGMLRAAKIWLLGRYNAVRIPFDVEKNLFIPSFVYRPLRGAPGALCAVIQTIPWMSDRARPFWVADETLALNAAGFAARSRLALLIEWLMIGFGVFAAIAVGAGFFDEDSAAVFGAVGRSVMIIGIGVALFHLFRIFLIDQPYERLVGVQDYYRFVQTLPTFGRWLVPMDGVSASRLFSGPPDVMHIDQDAPVMPYIVIGTMVIWLITSFKRFYMGCYWLFVRLPIQVTFERARAQNRWPSRAELEDAINKGTSNKEAWQARAMAKKADRFKSELDATTRSVRNKTRR